MVQHGTEQRYSKGGRGIVLCMDCEVLEFYGG